MRLSESRQENDNKRCNVLMRVSTFPKQKATETEMLLLHWESKLLNVNILHFVFYSYTRKLGPITQVRYLKFVPDKKPKIQGIPSVGSSRSRALTALTAKFKRDLTDKLLSLCNEHRGWNDFSCLLSRATRSTALTVTKKLKSQKQAKGKITAGILVRCWALIQQ